MPIGGPRGAVGGSVVEGERMGAELGEERLCWWTVGVGGGEAERRGGD
jgi:hypothetical protein